MPLMRKICLFSMIFPLTLPAFAQNGLPSALAEYYQPTDSESQLPNWTHKDKPGFIYRVCLDKQTESEERILVMCGDGDSENRFGYQSGRFDLWFLNGERIVSADTVEGEAKYGESGTADVVKIGKRWGIVTESGTDGQGAKIRYRHFYLPAGRNKVAEVAWLLVHVDNEPTCEVDESCLKDDLNAYVVFEENKNNDYPRMLIHSVGVLAGKSVDKKTTVLFDKKKGRYVIPDSIQDPQ